MCQAKFFNQIKSFMGLESVVILIMAREKLAVENIFLRIKKSSKDAENILSYWINVGKAHISRKKNLIFLNLCVISIKYF